MDYDRMIYRNLGPSGLKVSIMSFGNMTSGMSQNSLFDARDFAEEEKNVQFLDKVIRSGINFIDTAQNYGSGVAETILGRNLKTGGWDRDELVISTKFSPFKFGIQGLTRKYVRHSAYKSLDRLQLDFADVFFYHRPDYTTPALTQARVMNHLIDNEKCLYWGTSEHSISRICEMIQVCEKHGLEPPIVEQSQYNMLIRNNIEREMVPIFEHYGYGITAWSPLYAGLLTGKYNDGNIPEDSRFQQQSGNPLIITRYNNIFKDKEKACNMLSGLGNIATELGITQAQLALAWVMKNPDVSTAITGATRLEQIENNLGALDAMSKLTPEILNRIEDLLQNRPDPPMNWKTWQPFPPRR